MALETGSRGRASARVTPDKTAEAWGSGDVPVYGTPSLVALLETAAVNAVAGKLGPGETFLPRPSWWESKVESSPSPWWPTTTGPRSARAPTTG